MVAIISLIVGIRLGGRNPKLPRSIIIFSPALPKHQQNWKREGNDWHLAEMAYVTRKDSINTYVYLLTKWEQHTWVFQYSNDLPKDWLHLRIDNLIKMSSTKYNTSLATVLGFILPSFSNSWEHPLLNFLTYSDTQSNSNESPVK